MAIDRKIVVHVSTQRAELWEGEAVFRSFVVSTSKYGLGFEVGSNKTPLGRFRVCEKIGGAEPLGAVFKARVPTGAVCTPETPLWSSDEDLILSRILWLEGLDAANANTRGRYIYLHGTNQENLLGTPVSHGCVRFSNRDIRELFDLIEEGCEVVIQI